MVAFQIAGDETEIDGLRWTVHASCICAYTGLQSNLCRSIYPVWRHRSLLVNMLAKLLVIIVYACTYFFPFGAVFSKRRHVKTCNYIYECKQYLYISWSNLWFDISYLQIHSTIFSANSFHHLTCKLIPTSYLQTHSNYLSANSFQLLICKHLTLGWLNLDSTFIHTANI